MHIEMRATASHFGSPHDWSIVAHDAGAW